MKMRRTPFYGDPEDRELLGPSFQLVTLDEMTDVPPRGFMPHQGENRTQRRAAVANWVPPKQITPVPAGSEVTCGFHTGTTPAPMPTRRELWLQRAKQRRGKLDPELRRLQRRKAESK